MTTEQDRINLNKDVSNTSDVVDERRDEADEPGPSRTDDSLSSINSINGVKRVGVQRGRKTEQTVVRTKQPDLGSRIEQPKHLVVLGGKRDGSTLKEIKAKVAKGAVVYVDGSNPSAAIDKELDILRDANPKMKFGIHAKTGTFNGKPFEAENILKELPNNLVILEQTDRMNKTLFDSIAAAFKGEKTVKPFGKNKKPVATKSYESPFADKDSDLVKRENKEKEGSSIKQKQKTSGGKMSDKELSELNISTKAARTKFISGMIKMGKKLSAGDFKFAKANKLFEEDSDTSEGNLGGRSKEQDGRPSNAKPTE
jgi:hypothetical protein